MSDKPLYLMIGDKMVELKEIPNIEPTTESNELVSITHSYSGTFECRISKNQFNYLIGGREFVSNNWLKHHGLPMKRR